MKRMDELCDDLIWIDRFYQRKQAQIDYGVFGAHKPSKAQVGFESCHLEDVEGYTVVYQDGEYVVSSPNAEFRLKENEYSCIRENCQVKCSKYPEAKGCAHRFTCTCGQYALKNMCKHSHVVAVLNHPGSVASPSGHDSPMAISKEHEQEHVDDSIQGGNIQNDPDTVRPLETV